MNIKSNCFCRKVLLVTFFVSALTLNGSGHAVAGEALQLMQPLAPAATAAYSADDTGREASEPHVSRRGTVAIDTAIFDQSLIITDDKRGAASGFSAQQLLLSFFPEKDFSITVRSASRSPRNNILKVRGTVGAHSIGSFTMTIGPDSYLLTLQDLDSTFVYRVVGDMATGVGRVQEIDLSKMPAIYDSEPVVIP
jgi:hypothetical protein